MGVDPKRIRCDFSSWEVGNAENLVEVYQTEVKAALKECAGIWAGSLYLTVSSDEGDVTIELVENVDYETQVEFDFFAFLEEMKSLFTEHMFFYFDDEAANKKIKENIAARLENIAMALRA